MKKWYSAISLMLAALLILGCLTVAFAQDEGKSKTIVLSPINRCYLLAISP